MNSAKFKKAYPKNPYAMYFIQAGHPRKAGFQKFFLEVPFVRRFIANTAGIQTTNTPACSDIVRAPSGPWRPRSAATWDKKLKTSPKPDSQANR